MGPVLLIIAVNIVVFVRVMRTVLSAGPKFARSDSARSTEGMAKVNEISRGAKATVSFFALLGVTWVFGALAVGGSAVLFIYLFAICNTLQGLMLATFHCFLDQK